MDGFTPTTWAGGGPPGIAHTELNRIEAAIEMLFAVNPVGKIVARPYSAVPAGWLLCNGQAVSRATYAELHALAAADGYPDGNGDGSTTFNLPDYRGRVLLGKAASGTGSTLGEAGGALDHVHVGGAHQHGVSALVVPAHSQHEHGPGTYKGRAGAESQHTHSAAGLETSEDTHNHTVLASTLVGSTAPDPGFGAVAIRALQNGSTNNDTHSHNVTGTTGGGAGTQHEHNVTGSSALGGPTTHGTITGLVDSGGAVNTGGANMAYRVVNYFIFTGVIV